MDTSKYICSETSLIKDVMKIIDSNGNGFVFIVNTCNQVIGMMTDGDIRRLLLEGYGLNEPIISHMNINFEFAYDTDCWEKIASKLDNTVAVLPILNNKKHLVDIATAYKDKKVSLAQPQMNGNEYKYLMDAFLSTWISSTGKYITLFEKLFSNYCGKKYGIATANGTTALHLALVALEIGKGDEVIVPNLTFAATINAVLYVGATPVIVDVENDSWCIDPNAIENAITKRTKAIIPVHIYGQPCDMKAIKNIANREGLYIIEDCAEAHGAEYDGVKVGAFSDISCFSFFGNKVITTGEGGMCLTDNNRLAEKMKLLRDHGMSRRKKYYHEVVGFNYRMTNMQAAIGSAQVEHIDEILKWRDDLEKKYSNIFKEYNCISMQKKDLTNRKKINWLISILVDCSKRNKVLDQLHENGIDARPFFTPLSEMNIYRKYAKGDYTVSRDISQRGINLPTTISVNEDLIRKIADIILLV